MARTRSLLHIRDSATLVFSYRRNNPATGFFFDDVAITACTVEVRNGETGGSILPATAMTYDGNRDGYVYAWSYGSLLDSVRVITVRFVPTRAASTPAALAPNVTEDYDLADVLERVDELATDVPTVNQIWAVDFGNGRTPKQALQFLRNRKVIDGGIAYVYAEDDTTVSWTMNLTYDPLQQPVVEVNPA